MSESIERTMLITVQFFLLAMSFCCGVYAVVNCLLMPFSLQNSSNSCELNSPPLSAHKHLTNNPVSFSTILLKHLKECKASYFSAKKYTHVFLLKSSIKHKMYLFLLLDVGVIATNVCMNKLQLLSCSPSASLRYRITVLLPNDTVSTSHI